MDNRPQQTFTEGLHAAARPIWERQQSHPFLLGLADGSLPPAKFLFYTRQDVGFLRELNRVFAYTAARSDDPDDQTRFARLLIETNDILDSLHARFAALHGLTAADLSNTPLAPTAYAYTRHLLSTALADTYPALVAALLPSHWMYDELGKRLAASGPPPADHPYRDWLLVHAGPHLEETTAWLRTILDRAAGDLSTPARAHLTDVFLISSRYEIAFWDMSWREEG